ncbi:MAG: LuxR C-terminal-related transcriptional regulator, partial [Anaerolineae bacterium]|nr:LuxR C-terminal-related transcriptional regulator [Anaerolineae bacterium]
VHLTSMAVWELGAAEYAAACRRLLLDLVAAGVGHNWWGPHELMLARMTALSGAIDEAGDWFAQARIWTDGLSHRYLAAIIDYDEALAMARTGAPDRALVEQLLGRALAAFGRLEMVGWARRALGLQEQIAASPSPATSPSLPDRLTAREAQVLRLLAGGLTNREIAERLVVSVPTVARHIANIYTKIGARRRAEATAYALRHGLNGTPSRAVARRPT